MKTKRILTDNYEKMFFAFVDENTNRVETTNVRSWIKSSLKDNSNEYMKTQMLKAILNKEKQFNKKVSYNVWVKSNNPTFEQKLHYLLYNDFYSVTKKGIQYV